MSQYSGQYSHEVETLIEQIPSLRAAKDYGIDIQQLLDNFHRSPAERIKRHRIALNTFKVFTTKVNN